MIRSPGSGRWGSPSPAARFRPPGARRCRSGSQAGTRWGHQGSESASRDPFPVAKLVADRTKRLRRDVSRVTEQVPDGDRIPRGQRTPVRGARPTHEPRWTSCPWPSMPPRTRCRAWAGGQAGSGFGLTIIVLLPVGSSVTTCVEARTHRSSACTDPLDGVDRHRGLQSGIACYRPSPTMLASSSSTLPARRHAAL